MNHVGSVGEGGEEISRGTYCHTGSTAGSTQSELGTDHLRGQPRECYFLLVNAFIAVSCSQLTVSSKSPVPFPCCRGKFFWCDYIAFNALTLLVEWQEVHPACKNWVIGCWHGYVDHQQEVLFAEHFFYCMWHSLDLLTFTFVSECHAHSCRFLAQRSCVVWKWFSMDRVAIITFYQYGSRKLDYTSGKVISHCRLLFLKTEFLYLLVVVKISSSLSTGRSQPMTICVFGAF